MSFYQLTPLAPAGLLMLGALLILISNLAPATVDRRWLLGGLSAIVLLSPVIMLLAATGGDSASSSNLVSWLDHPGLSFRLGSLDPVAWVLLASAAAALLALPAASRSALTGAASLLAMAASGYLLVLSGDVRTLAITLFAFDAVVAVLLLLLRHRQLALARLLIGAAQIILLMGVALTAPMGAASLNLGGVFSLLLWVRLGLYPLVEVAKIESGELMPLTLGWHALQLGVGLYLAGTGFAPWLLWPAIGAGLLHAMLAWLSKNRERSVGHTAYAMASMVMVGLALGQPSASALPAAVLLPLALIAVALTSQRTGGLAAPRAAQDWLRLWNYVPLALATLSLAGAPLTLGSTVLGAVFDLSWDRRLIGIVLLLVFTQGAGLSVLYRYWRTVWQSPDGSGVTAHRVVAASLAAIPFLLPVLGRQIWMAGSVVGQNAGTVAPGIGGWIGLGGALLWALFLGYSQPLVLRRLPWRREVLMSWLRLEPVTGLCVNVSSFTGGVLLRLRVIFEGEHYLAWAVLVVVFGILLTLVYSTSILP